MGRGRLEIKSRIKLINWLEGKWAEAKDGLIFLKFAYKVARLADGQARCFSVFAACK